MSWIKVIAFSEATGKLRKLFERVKGPNGQIDNILQVHSLRPHSLEGHMRLYKNVLHHRENTLPKWYLESLGVYVSQLNDCAYCVEHHAAGLKRLLDDEARFEVLYDRLKKGQPEEALEGKWLVGMRYARTLSQRPAEVTEKHIDDLRGAGFSDGEILEINQVVSYFHYANRTVLGLGVNTQGEILGLSPSDDDNHENWSHQL